MAGLWRKLPQLMADKFGFIEVINQTEGMGIIDDCSEYLYSSYDDCIEAIKARRNE